MGSEAKKKNSNIEFSTKSSHLVNGNVDYNIVYIYIGNTYSAEIVKK